MKTVADIIEKNGGLMGLFKLVSLTLRNPEGAVLEIKSLGPGPNYMDAVSVVLYEERTEKNIRAPEFNFEIDGEGRWLPFYYGNDFTGEEFFVYTINRHLLVINLELRRYLSRRAGELNLRLEALGFPRAGEDLEYYPLFPLTGSE